MKSIKNKITFINMLFSLILQLVTILSGFIIPKLILLSFGSNVNGLVSSLTQFLNYIALFEGGITGVVTANLYRPLINRDMNKVSMVLKSSDVFYKKIGLIFAIYTLFLALIYPLLFHTGFSYIYVFSLTFILAINLFIQYMFSLTLRTLLIADKKIYIISIVQIIILLIGIIFAFISIKIYPNIHFFKLITGLTFIIQPIFYNIYVKKNYPINFKVTEDQNLLSQRWNGFAVNIAYFVHSCTDISILTIFTNLATVSVYSVYSLVTTGLKQVINSVDSAINPTIGQSYARGDLKDLYNKLDIYEYIQFSLVFFFFSLAFLLIIPFVILYTKGINDANYNQPLFSFLLILSEMMYLLKMPHLNLAYSANKFKELTFPSFLEALINIIISIILVNYLGLVGVAIGTLIAMTYRMIAQILFTKSLIGRNPFIYYKKILIFLIFYISGIIICKVCISSNIVGINDWIFHACIYSFVLLMIHTIMTILFFNKFLRVIINYIKKPIKGVSL